MRIFLNKLTARNVETMSKQFYNLKIDTEEKLASVISLIFEKASNEPNFTSAYAQLSLKLSIPMKEQDDRWKKNNKDTIQDMFRSELLKKCQTEFDAHVFNENSISEKLRPIQQELDETTDNKRKLELAVQLEEEERKFCRRCNGIVRFIGELYVNYLVSKNYTHYNHEIVCGETVESRY